MANGHTLWDCSSFIKEFVSRVYLVLKAFWKSYHIHVIYSMFINITISSMWEMTKGHKSTFIKIGSCSDNPRSIDMTNND